MMYIYLKRVRDKKLEDKIRDLFELILEAYEFEISYSSYSATDIELKSSSIVLGRRNSSEEVDITMGKPIKDYVVNHYKDISPDLRDTVKAGVAKLYFQLTKKGS